MTDWRQDIIQQNPNLYSIYCGDGWRPLIKAAADYIQRLPCTSIVQVKEKFGTLRIYVAHDPTCRTGSPRNEECLYHTTALNFVDAMEYASLRMCEMCGAHGRLRGDRSWIRTLCDQHAKERA